MWVYYKTPNIFYLQRVHREQKVWAQTDHENVVPLLGTTTDYSIPFAGPRPIGIDRIAMISPWMNGGNLQEKLETDLEESERIHLVRPSRTLMMHLLTWLLQRSFMA